MDYDVAVCKRTFSSVSLQEGEQECFPRCFLVFVFISFFRPHLSVVVLHFVKCWHSFRRSCIITPPVWSAADAQEEEEEQRDDTDITTKLPSLTFLQHVSDIRALTCDIRVEQIQLWSDKNDSWHGPPCLPVLWRGGPTNGQDKLKSQPAILLFRSVDAIKQENGVWRP